jgi:transposase, IS30 family
VRTGRALRKPGRVAGQRKNRVPDRVSIAAACPRATTPGAGRLGGRRVDRQAQRDGDRLRWSSANGVMLVPLPNGYKPEHVAPALAKKAQTLRNALRRLSGRNQPSSLLPAEK